MKKSNCCPFNLVWFLGLVGKTLFFESAQFSHLIPSL